MLTLGSLPFIVILSVISAAIIAMHSLANFGRGKAAFVFNAIGIVLHLAAVALFLFTRDGEGRALGLDSVVLYFLLSLLVYTSMFFVASRRAGREGGASEGEVSGK